MPIVSYTTIGGGLVGADKALLRRYFGFERSLTSRKRSFFSRGELAALPGLSLLPAVAAVWNALSDSDKAEWSAAGEVIGLNGYNLFCQDQSYRLKNSIPGSAVPSLFHQYLIGHLHVPVGSGDVAFKQMGNEVFTFPATLYLSRKSALLTDPADGNFLKIVFSYNYDDGGGEQTQSNELSISLASAWTSQTLPITSHTGLTGHWELEISAHDVQGDFYFDNLYLMSAGSVITKDPFCEEVEKRWLQLLAPAGVILETVYPVGGAL